MTNAAERGLRPSELITIQPTSFGNKNIPIYIGHSDGSALHRDYGVDTIDEHHSYNTEVLGSILDSVVPGVTRKSIFQSNTPGLLVANVKLQVENAFPYVMEPDDHRPPADWETYAQRFRELDYYANLLIGWHPDTYMLVTTQSGLITAMSNDGRIGLIKSVEGMPQRIDVPLSVATTTLRRANTQVVDLMWNYSTDVGDSHTTPEDNGLTLRGAAFIQACADHGIPVFDVSHASQRTAKDMIKLVGPNRRVIASHTGARIKDTPSFENTRNITDDVAQGIFERNGIVGVALAGGMLGGNTINHVVSAIQHFVELDPTRGRLVTLGPNFNGISVESRIENASTVIELKNIAEALRKDGFTDDMIENIFWKNAYDFWHDALADAAKPA